MSGLIEDSWILLSASVVKCCFEVYEENQASHFNINVFFNIHPNSMRYDFLAAVWNLKLYQWTFHVVFYVNICWFTLHFDICSAFKWSFNEFVGEKVISLSYSSAIFSPPRLPCTLNGSLYPCMVLSCHVLVTWKILVYWVMHIFQKLYFIIQEKYLIH